jgi:pimeloyl-ACP methyl ester carboxylesterase
MRVRYTFGVLVFVALWMLGCATSEDLRERDVSSASSSEHAPLPPRTTRFNEPIFGGQAVVHETGREHPRSIMLIHGIGDNASSDFDDHVTWLARSYHVVTVDLPGFGASSKGNEMYSPGNYAKFLKYVANRFMHRPFVLLGHSMGGVVALRYAATYPDDVERLVVVDVPGVLHGYAYTSQYIDRADVGFLNGHIERIGALARRLMGHAESGGHINAQEILESRNLRYRLLGGEAANIAGLAMAVEDLSADLPRISIETLVIWGKQDKTAPLRSGKLLAHVMPRARLEVIDDAGHVPMRETPERFHEILERFLRQGATPPDARPDAELAKRGRVHCRDKSGTVYQGEYDEITLTGCRDVTIRNARVRRLRVIRSSVAIENSHIGGGAVGVDALDSRLNVTNSKIEGGVAVSAAGSDLDFAGTQIEGRSAIATSPSSASTIVFSVSKIRSPHVNGEAHGVYRVVRGKPLYATAIAKSDSKN